MSWRAGGKVSLKKHGAAMWVMAAVSAASLAYVSSAAAQTALPPVQVDGQGAAPDANPYADPAANYKADRLSSNKFAEPILDTARSVTVLTKEALDDKNATSLREIGRSTAGVTLGSGEGGFSFGDRFFIRGFDARNDVFFNGVRDPGVAIRENYNVEQVEILRGPASSYAGRGTTGGALNIVTKQAHDTNFYNAEATYGIESNTKRLTTDANQVITPDLDLRLSGMMQSSDVAGRDLTTDNRQGIHGAVAYRATDDLTITGNYSYTHIYGLPDYGVPYNTAARRPVTSGDVPRGTFYGITNRDFSDSEQGMGDIGVTWVANDWLTLKNAFHESHTLYKYIGTIPENPGATGVTAPYSSTATTFSGYTQLNAQSRHLPIDVMADQPEATFTFDTGPVHNTLTAGGDFSNERLSIDSYTGFTSELTTGPVAFTSTGAPVVPIDNPIHQIFGTGVTRLTGNPLRYHVNTAAGYVMDTANYNNFIIVNGGIRYDDYKIQSFNNTSAREADSGITSYNVGVVVKPTDNSSVYGAYATSANPVGSELDSTSSAYGGLAAAQPTTQIFGPQKNRAFEVGTKWELFDRHLLATAAVFQTNVSNARETAPAGVPGTVSGQIYANAAYRLQGLDFELAGKITDKWSILGGLVLLKSKVTNSVVPNNIGLQLANISHESFSMLSKYQVLNWLELGGQAIYASKVKGGTLLAANGGAPTVLPIRETFLPSHWRFDTFVEAKVIDHVTLKLNVENIFNTTYYESLYQSFQPFVRVAPGRNISLVASVKY